VNRLNSEAKSIEEDKHSQKDFDELHNYLKSVLSINKSLSSVFMGITLTAFVFLVSLGFPDILDLELIIGGISIKSVQFSLILLVLSFFFFLSSTLLYHISELKIYSFYLYWDSKLTLSERYKKSEKVYIRYYSCGNFFLFFAVNVLIIAVIFIFLTFSVWGIMIFIVTIITLGIAVAPTLLYFGINKVIKKRKKVKK